MAASASGVKVGRRAIGIEIEGRTRALASPSRTNLRVRFIL
jgi:hypothetical protein